MGRLARLERRLERAAAALEAMAGPSSADAASQREEMARCAADPCHFVDSWCRTFDPRLKGEKTVPFKLYPIQADFLRWLADREAAQEDGLADKSRDMGATWLAVAYCVHGWLFRPGFSAGFGSRKLELVDSLGDPDSILEKARILLDNLPAWMRPPGYVREKHAGHCRFVNPQNGATITGEGGDNIGRGGRKSIYFVDEAAFIARPKLVERSLSQTTNCRIDISTPNGPGNPFAQRRFSGAVKVFTLHWRKHPLKDERWYAAMKARFDSVTVAQEIDIDYAASVEGVIIPAAWVRAAVGLRVGGKPLAEAVPGGRLAAGLDISESGSAETVLTPRRGPVVFPCIAWSRENTTQTAMRAREEAERLGVLCVAYESAGVGAGVRGTWDSSPDRLPFKALALATGSAPTNTRWPDGRLSKQRFLNLRAELWWMARTRFERAYEFREKGIMHPPEDMISIPDDPELIAQLSMPLSEYTSDRRIKVESKEDMAKRGVKSPDRADSLVLSLHPQADREPSAWRFGEV